MDDLESADDLTLLCRACGRNWLEQLSAACDSTLIKARWMWWQWRHRNTHETLTLISPLIKSNSRLSITEILSRMQTQADWEKPRQQAGLTLCPITKLQVDKSR